MEAGAEAEAMEDAASWLPAYSIQNSAQDGSTHNKLCLCTSIINEENAPKAHLGEACSQLRFCLLK